MKTAFDPYEVEKHVQATGSVVNFPDSKAISNADLLAMEVTVLAPCAMELQITKDNAADVKAKIIVEGCITARQLRKLTKSLIRKAFWLYRIFSPTAAA